MAKTTTTNRRREDLKYLKPTLILTYAEGCTLLRYAGVDKNDYDNLNTENEKLSGDIVQQEYDADFFFLFSMDKYPLAGSIQPIPNYPIVTIYFIRGQEVLIKRCTTDSCYGIFRSSCERIG